MTLLLAAWLSATSSAQECDGPSSWTAVDRELGLAIDRISKRADKDAAAESAARARSLLACLDVVVEPEQVGRVAQVSAMVAWANQDEEAVESWTAAAHYAARGLAWPDEAMGALINARPSVEQLESVAPTFSAEVARDSVYSSGWARAEPLAVPGVPHLVQLTTRSGRVKRAFWEDDPSYGDLTGDGPVQELGEADRVRNERQACEGFSNDRLQQLLAESSMAGALDEDAEAHLLAYGDVMTGANCLEEPVASLEWAIILAREAIRLYLTDPESDAWVSIADAANSAYPDVFYKDVYDASFLDEDFRPAWMSRRGAELARGESLGSGTFWVDGQPTRDALELRGPHVIQRENGGTWDSRVVTDGEFPEEWFGSGGGGGPVRPAAVGSGAAFVPLPGWPAIRSGDGRGAALANVAFWPLSVGWVAVAGFTASSPAELAALSGAGIYATAVGVNHVVAGSEDRGRTWIGLSPGVAVGLGPGPERLSGVGAGLGVPLVVPLTSIARLKTSVELGRIQTTSRVSAGAWVGEDQVRLFADPKVAVTGAALLAGPEIRILPSGFSPLFGAQAGVGLAQSKVADSAVQRDLEAAVGRDEAPPAAATRLAPVGSLHAGVETGGERGRAFAEVGMQSSFLAPNEAGAFRFEGAFHNPVVARVGFRMGL